MRKDYYIYLHVKETTGEPFYIGKGIRSRAYSKNSRNCWWNNIVAKHGFDVILLEEGLSEEEAFQRETYWINRIGRRDLGTGPLVNMTDGGEGSSGATPWNKGKTGVQKGWNKGKQRSIETRKKISEAQLGKTIPKETRKKMSESHKGKLAGDKNPMYGKTPNNARQVVAYYVCDDKKIGIYKTIKEASDKLGLSYSSVNQVLSGKMDKVKGIKIKYYEEN